MLTLLTRVEIFCNHILDLHHGCLVVLLCAHEESLVRVCVYVCQNV